MCLVLGIVSVVWGQSSTAVVKLESRTLFEVGNSQGVAATDRAAKIVRRLEILVNRREAVASPKVRDTNTNGGESLVLFDGTQ